MKFKDEFNLDLILKINEWKALGEKYLIDHYTIDFKHFEHKFKEFECNVEKQIISFLSNWSISATQEIYVIQSYNMF